MKDRSGSVRSVEEVRFQHTHSVFGVHVTFIAASHRNESTRPFDARRHTLRDVSWLHHGHYRMLCGKHATAYAWN
jgi:hypothetical protein